MIYRRHNLNNLTTICTCNRKNQAHQQKMISLQQKLQHDLLLEAERGTAFIIYIFNFTKKEYGRKQEKGKQKFIWKEAIVLLNKSSFNQVRF